MNPPLDLVQLAEFYNESTWHRNAVRVKARDLVGHGWTLEPEFSEGGEPPGATTEKEQLDTFFWNGGVDGFSQVEGIEEPIPLYSSLSEVLERVLVDLDTIGNGYLAVIRDDRASGVPIWFAHVQGSRVRIHKDRVRFSVGGGAGAEALVQEVRAGCGCPREGRQSPSPRLTGGDRQSPGAGPLQHLHSHG